MKFVLFAALAIAIASPAHAGPVMGAVAWVGGVLKAGGIAAAMMQLALGVGAQILSGVLGKAMAARPKIDVQFDVQFGDDTALAFIAGDYVTAGKRKYIGSWGKNTRYITEVVELSCLPQPGLAGIWVDDVAGEIKATTDTDGTAYNLGYPLRNYGEGGNRIWVRFIDGTQTAADPTLVAIFGGDPDYPWTSAMIGTGKSYAVVTTRYDGDGDYRLTSYPAYLFQPQPLAMYDPRRDGSTGGSGAHRWGNRATYAPTRNPAVIAYNIVRGIYFGGEWIFGGKNLPAWRLPRAEWVAAMNACDRAITLAGGGTEPAYRCGLQITADMTAADVLEEIGRAANMRFAEVGGRLKPIVDLPGAAVFAFTDDDVVITEGQSFKPFNSLSETFNAISASYPEPGEKWATRDAPEFVHATATAEDGGRYLPVSVAYPAAPYRRQVQRLMRAQLSDYRRARIVQISLPPDAYALEPLVDVVSWTSARNGFNNKLFVVENVAKTPGMLVRVTLREVDPADYDWSSDFEMPTEVVPPVVVLPWQQVISGFAVVAETVTDAASKARAPSIRVSCSGDEVGVRRIRIQVRKRGDAEAQLDIERPFDAPFVWRILSVVQATDYQVRARLVSDLTPRAAWTAWVNVTTPAIYIDDSDILGGVLGLFANAGIKATRIIANLSAAGGAVGELAWCLADNRLYRWSGSAWVHFIQESVQGILDQTAFAAGLRVPKVITGTLPTAGQVIGNLAYRTNDGLIYRWTGTEWTAEVTATQIVGQLIAGQIAAGAIGADQIAAGAFLASKAGIMDFTNRVPDSELQDAAAWTGVANDGTGVFRLRPSSLSPPALSEGDIIYLAERNTANANVNSVSDFIPVAAGDVLYAAGQLYRSGGTTARAFIDVLFYDKSRTFLSNASIHSMNGAGYLVGLQSSEVVVPAGAAWCRYRMYVYGAETDGNVVFAAPKIRLKNKGELIVEGTIRGIHIEFETLTGGLMAATGIISKSGQIDNLVVKSIHIGNNELYIPRFYSRADVQLGPSSSKSSPVTLFDRTIPDFNGGGYIIAFNGMMDSTDSVDRFSHLQLLVDGTLVAETGVGARSDGSGGIKAIIPVALISSATGFGSTRIIVRGWARTWSDPDGGGSNTWMRNMTLTVSGTRK